MPIGAEVAADGVDFRVWAPEHERVNVVPENMTPVTTRSDGNGYFRVFVSGLKAGARYRFEIDDKLYPDPASRFQPEGPHGPSQVVDPQAYSWRHLRRGAQRAGQIIYELHIGTFTG